MGRRTFSVEQANVALAEVRPLAERTVELSRRLPELHEELRIRSYRAGRPGGTGSDVEGVELAADELRQAETDLEAALHALVAQGVELKDAMVGVVDFPSERDGEPIELCWRLGEDRIAHWHPLDGGFRGRRPLP
ncbi:MAG: DUF2203 domain-containing protein [Candidatus Dormibacteraceae bacterium]